VRTDFPNDTFETREYDDVGHLTFLENRGPTGVIASYRYTLAATGLRDAVVEDTGRRVSYQYAATGPSATPTTRSATAPPAPTPPRAPRPTTTTPTTAC
jgi:hypothetical protein